MWLSGAKRLRQQSEVHNNIHHFDVEVAPTHRSHLALLSTNVDPHEKQLVINVNVDWFQPYKHLNILDWSYLCILTPTVSLSNEL